MDNEKMKSVIVVVITILTIIIVESMGSIEKVADDYQKMAIDAIGKPIINLANNTSSKKDSKPSCSKKGHNLYGKVQFVDSFPDLTIQYVSSFPDIKVEFVSSFPSNCGQWQVVDSFPDFKVQVVSSFPDLKVEKVSSFPGMY
jgi:hypothetical protein